MLEVHVPEGVWRFKSSRPHQPGSTWYSRCDEGIVADCLARTLGTPVLQAFVRSCRSSIDSSFPRFLNEFPCFHLACACRELSRVDAGKGQEQGQSDLNRFLRNFGAGLGGRLPRQHARFQQGEARPSVHLALDHFQPVDVSLHRPR